MFPIRKIKFRRDAPSGITSYFGFEGNYNDTIGGHNGTPVNAPPFVTGKVGQAISLDGSSQMVSVADDAAFHINAWSVSAWIYLIAGGGVEQGILGTRFGGDNTYDIKIRATPGPQVHTDIGDGGAWLDIAADANYPFTTDTWYMITQTVGNGRYEIYVNGTWIGGNNIVGTPLLMKAGQTMGLGNSNASEYLKGILDELYIYPFVLHDVDVSALYNAARV